MRSSRWLLALLLLSTRIVAARREVCTIYIRDLDSSVARTYGFGAGVHALPLRPRLSLDLSADAWDEPGLPIEDGAYFGFGIEGVW